MLEVIKHNAPRLFALNLLSLPLSVLTPYVITNEVGVAGYGWYMLWWSFFLNAIQIANAFSSGLQTKLPSLIEVGNQSQLKIYFYSAHVVSLLVSILIAIPSLLIAITYSKQSNPVWIFFLIIIVALTVPSVHYFAAINKFYLRPRAELSSRIAAIILIFMASISGVLSPEQCLIISIISFMGFRIALHRKAASEILLNNVAQSIERSEKPLSLADGSRKLIKYGAASAVTVFANFLGVTGYYYLVSIKASLSIVGYFALILIPITLFSQLYRMFSMVLVPNISKLSKVESVDRINKYLINSTLISVFISSLIILVLNAVGLFVEEFEELPYGLFLAEALACVQARILFLSTSPLQNILRAIDKPQIQAVINLTFVAILPCLFLTLISSRVGLEQVVRIYMLGQVLGAFAYGISMPIYFYIKRSCFSLKFIAVYSLNLIFLVYFSNKLI